MRGLRCRPGRGGVVRRRPCRGRRGRRRSQRRDLRLASRLPLAIDRRRVGVRARLDVGADHDGRRPRRPRHRPRPAAAGQLRAIAQRAARPARLPRRVHAAAWVPDDDRQRRQRRRTVQDGAGVVEVHEHVHVWQARWFGPLYPLLYGAWTVLGAAVGVVAWVATGRRDHVWRVVEAWAYYRNPFEWWAYSREGRWPPPRALAEHVWRRPMRVFRAGKPSA